MSTTLLRPALAPFVQEVRVKVPPSRAFELFTAHMGRWWPAGMTVGKQPHVAIVVEPRAGGRWFERDADGHETQWGTVAAWEPPHRALLTWQITCEDGYDPAVRTEVELTFAPDGSGGTRVTLTHGKLEGFGERAEHQAGKIGQGWPMMLGKFADYANAGG